MPPDAEAHLGFRVAPPHIYHLVKTPRGVEVVSKRCEDCVFYRLMESGYVYGAPALEGGRIKIVVRDSRATRRILAESQVVKIEAVRWNALVLTPTQREVLKALANGHNISSLARETAKTKAAVYKTFKKALKKILIFT